MVEQKEACSVAQQVGALELRGRRFVAFVLHSAKWLVPVTFTAVWGAAKEAIFTF